MTGSRTRRAACLAALASAAASAAALAVAPPSGTVDQRGAPSVTIAFGGALGQSYSPKLLLVNPGQTITWSGNFTTHPLEPRGTGNPIPAVPGGGSQQVTATFQNPGTYNYVCTAHEAFGMVGTVYVQGPPQAALAAPTNPTAGPVALNAGASDEVNGTIAGYRWDLDGNGSFELDTGATATTTATLAEGARTVSVEARDADGRTSVATRTFTVAPAGPGGPGPGPGTPPGSGAGGVPGSTGGTPGAGPPPEPKAPAGAVNAATTITFPARVRRTTLGTTGVGVAVTSPVGGRMVVTLAAGSTVLTRATRSAVAGVRIPLRLKLGPGARAKAHDRRALTLRITVTSVHGTTTRTASITLR